MGDLIGLMSVILLFGSIPAIIIYIARSRHLERVKLIDRGEYTAFSRLDVQSPPLPGRFALFFGLIFIGLGLAGIIYFIVLGIDEEEAFFFALASLVVGGAMLLYYRMLAPLREKASLAYDKQLELMEVNGKRAAAAVKGAEVPQIPNQD
ncbi:MAG: hypothetical protein JXQ83_14625 [Candidatus Glassbacteria bacterium]|nr:hypothetical protein [Candidatus Glassbacteria bacterium]